MSPPAAATGPTGVGKDGGKGKRRPSREYLGWESANIVEWKVAKTLDGQRNWEERWACPNPWMRRYEKWICSGMSRALRKPSFRAIEWKAYQDKCGGETAVQSECRTRQRRRSIRDWFIEPIDRNACCCPGPWPKTTAAEVGYLAKHPGCALEIYPNDFMKKPPLPWYVPKISSYISNSQ